MSVCCQPCKLESFLSFYSWTEWVTKKLGNAEQWHGVWVKLDCEHGGLELLHFHLYPGTSWARGLDEIPPETEKKREWSATFQIGYKLLLLRSAIFTMLHEPHTLKCPMDPLGNPSPQVKNPSVKKQIGLKAALCLPGTSLSLPGTSFNPSSKVNDPGHLVPSQEHRVSA